MRNEANNNDIHHNIIIESGKGIKIHTGAYSNTFHYNTIINPREIGNSVQYPDTKDNRFDNNQVIDSKLQEGDTNKNQIRNMLTKKIKEE